MPVFSFPVTVVCLGALAGITGGGGNALLGSESEGLALEEAVVGISAVRVIEAPGGRFSGS